MRARRPTRVRGFPYRGLYRYHLRFTTDGRARLFTERTQVEAARTQIQRTAEDERFVLLAYCFMPDHLHLVIEGTDETSDMRRFAKISKQRVTYVFRIQFSIASTWQEGHYDRVLRSDESTEVVIRYVLDNPVRAGLVTRAEDYPFSGALFWPAAC
jgi:putative transposase